MSIKNQFTKSDYLDWNEATNLVNKLERDNEYIFALLIACGIYTGLRISDILQLRWSDLLNNDSISVIERKTKKQRNIKLNENLKSFLKRLSDKIKPELKSFIITGKNGTSLSSQYINRKLKEFKIIYKLKIKNISTHTFRKSFGRHVWELHNHSEKSLLLLSELFNHSSVAITKRYLGIKEQELQAVYDLL